MNDRIISQCIGNVSKISGYIIGIRGGILFRIVILDDLDQPAQVILSIGLLLAVRIGDGCRKTDIFKGGLIPFIYRVVASDDFRPAPFILIGLGYGAI